MTTSRSLRNDATPPRELSVSAEREALWQWTRTTEVSVLETILEFRDRVESAFRRLYTTPVHQLYQSSGWELGTSFTHRLSLETAEKLWYRAHYYLLPLRGEDPQASEEKSHGALFSQYLKTLISTHSKEPFKEQFGKRVTLLKEDSDIQTLQKKWSTSKLLEIRIKGTLFGYAEILPFGTLKKISGEIPRAHKKVEEGIELFLGHFRTWLLEEENRELNIDRTTEVMNRASFYRQAPHYLTQHRKNLGVVLLFDLDRFKRINDKLGHATGDEALKHVAQAIDEIISQIPSAVFARYGWEEFIALVPGIDLEAGWRLADIIRRYIAGKEFHYTNDATQDCTRHITTSIWVAAIKMGAWQNTPTVTDLDEATRQADQALYVAKSLGRNQRHIYKAGMQPINLATKAWINIRTFFIWAKAAFWFSPKWEASGSFSEKIWSNIIRWTISDIPAAILHNERKENNRRVRSRDRQ